MSRSRKLFIASGVALMAAIAVFGGSFLTDGFGPCGSVTGMYCLFAMLFFLAIAGLLIIVAIAQSVIEHIRS